MRSYFHGDLDSIGEIRGLKRYWGKPVKHPANPLPGYPSDEVRFVTEQWRAFHVAVRHDDRRGVPGPRGTSLLLSSEHVEYSAKPIARIVSNTRAKRRQNVVE